MRIKDCFENYILVRKEDRSSNTISYYEIDLKQFDKFIDHKDIEEIKHEDIEKYKNYLLSLDLKPKTTNRKLLSLKQFINWVNEEYDLKKALKIETIKMQRQENQKELLNIKDFKSLVSVAQRENDKRAIAIFYTLYETGLTVSEMLQFKVSDINHEYKRIIGKCKNNRDVLITNKLRVYLKEYIKARNPPIGGFLFLNKNNDNVMSRQNVNKVIRQYAEKSKVKHSRAHAHNFRHLCGFNMINQGLTIDEVAEKLGHININTTKIYTNKDLLKYVRS